MANSFPIADMHIFPLAGDAGSRVLLREDDHLLRRFGQLELRDVEAGAQTELGIRAEADRLFFLLSGKATLHIMDLRSGSPSFGTHAAVQLDQENAQGVLAPFGTSVSLYPETDCRLLLLSTHSQPHPEDRFATKEELQTYAAIQ